MSLQGREEWLRRDRKDRASFRTHALSIWSGAHDMRCKKALIVGSERRDSDRINGNTGVLGAL